MSTCFSLGCSGWFLGVLDTLKGVSVVFAVVGGGVNCGVKGFVCAWLAVGRKEPLHVIHVSRMQGVEVLEVGVQQVSDGYLPVVRGIRVFLNLDVIQQNVVVVCQVQETVVKILQGATINNLLGNDLAYDNTASVGIKEQVSPILITEGNGGGSEEVVAFRGVIDSCSANLLQVILIVEQVQVRTIDIEDRGVERHRATGRHD